MKLSLGELSFAHLFSIYNMTSQNYQKGLKGEKIARLFLERKGYAFVQANYRIPGGEIDLIMLKENTLVFVEVKTRLKLDFGEPEDALTSYKKRKFLLAIYQYLSHNSYSRDWRADLVSILIIGRRASIRHYKNIYEN